MCVSLAELFTYNFRWARASFSYSLCQANDQRRNKLIFRGTCKPRAERSATSVYMLHYQMCSNLCFKRLNSVWFLNNLPQSMCSRLGDSSVFLTLV